MQAMKVGDKLTVPFRNDKQASRHMFYARRALKRINRENTDTPIDIEISTRFISKVIRIIRY